METLRDFWDELGWLVVTGVLVVACCLGGGTAFMSYQCDQLGARSGLKTEWHIVGGCYVEVNGRMIPQDNWRGEYEGGR